MVGDAGLVSLGSNGVVGIFSVVQKKTVEKTIHGMAEPGCKTTVGKMSLLVSAVCLFVKLCRDSGGIWEGLSDIVFPSHCTLCDSC